MSKLHKKDFKALGTDISIWIVSDEDKSQEIVEHLNELEDSYLKKHALLSRFSETSRLSQINNRLNEFFSAGSDLIHLSRSSIKYYRQTNGIFDPRIITMLEQIGYRSDFKTGSLEAGEPKIVNNFEADLEKDIEFDGDRLMFRSRMDFSGIAKGYVTDLAVDYLKKCSFENFLVDSGGDMYVAGCNIDGNKWRLSLEGVDDKKMQLEIENQAVATSGITRRKWENNLGRFHHLIKPQKTSDFDFDLKSVTFIADTTEEADVWAKSIFLMGKKEGMDFANERGLKCILLDYRGVVSVSMAAKQNLIIY